MSKRLFMLVVLISGLSGCGRITPTEASLTLGGDVIREAVEFCNKREGLDALRGVISPQGDTLQVRCMNGEGYLLEEGPKG